MAGGERTAFFTGLLTGGLPEALDLGSNASSTTNNTQQFVERQPPQDTQARSVQSPARLGFNSPLVLGGVALAVAIGVAMMVRK